MPWGWLGVAEQGLGGGCHRGGPGLCRGRRCFHKDVVMLGGRVSDLSVQGHSGLRSAEPGVGHGFKPPEGGRGGRAEPRSPGVPRMQLTLMGTFGAAQAVQGHPGTTCEVRRGWVRLSPVPSLSGWLLGMGTPSRQPPCLLAEAGASAPRSLRRGSRGLVPPAVPLS